MKPRNKKNTIGFIFVEINRILFHERFFDGLFIWLALMNLVFVMTDPLEDEPFFVLYLLGSSYDLSVTKPYQRLTLKKKKHKSR